MMYPPLLLSLLRRADQVLVLVLKVSSTSMSSVRVSLPEPPVDVRLRAVSRLLDVSPVAEYDVGKLLDLHVNLNQLSLKYNCLLKTEPSSNPSSYPFI